MALKSCHECKKEVAETAKVCPHCGVANPAATASTRALSALITLILAGAAAWYFFGGGLEKQAASSMDNIYSKVAADAVDQYRIAAQNGSAMDRCVQAGLVTAAFLQAKEDTSYARWKETESADCRAAGLPGR
jgi:hypothetical protein